MKTPCASSSTESEGRDPYQKPSLSLQDRGALNQQRRSLDLYRGTYPHSHETLVLYLVGAFQVNLNKKLVCLGTVIVTGTDNDYATVLATCPCGNTHHGQDHKQEGIVLVEKITIRDIARLIVLLS